MAKRFWIIILLTSCIGAMLWLLTPGYRRYENFKIKDHIKSINSNPGRSMDGEERARLVWEKCQQFPELNPCTYPSESFMKQMLTVPSKKFVQCTPGKTGSSNWKTLILLLNGKISPKEAQNITYPHLNAYWEHNATLLGVLEDGNADFGRQITEEYYKITFVRNPLTRLLSAYRDKFTGPSTSEHFKLYKKKSEFICSALHQILREKPDGNLIPEEIYSYLFEETKTFCRSRDPVLVSLGLLVSAFIFIPQDYHNQTHRQLDYLVDTHFSSMLSLCAHCRQRFDFIGTVETIESDFSFLKNKFKFPFDLPHIDSTQPGVLSKEAVNYMWEKLPDLLKQYVYRYLQDDAIIFGYDGFESSISRDSFPNHFEARTNCKNGEH